MNRVRDFSAIIRRTGASVIIGVLLQGCFTYNLLSETGRCNCSLKETKVVSTSGDSVVLERKFEKSLDLLWFSVVTHPAMRTKISPDGIDNLSFYFSVDVNVDDERPLRAREEQGVLFYEKDFFISAGSGPFFKGVIFMSTKELEAILARPFVMSDNNGKGIFCVACLESKMKNNGVRRMTVYTCGGFDKSLTVDFRQPFGPTTVNSSWSRSGRDYGVLTLATDAIALPVALAADIVTFPFQCAFVWMFSGLSGVH